MTRYRNRQTVTLTTPVSYRNPVSVDSDYHHVVLNDGGLYRAHSRELTRYDDPSADDLYTVRTSLTDPSAARNPTPSYLFIKVRNDTWVRQDTGSCHTDHDVRNFTVISRPEYEGDGP